MPVARLGTALVALGVTLLGAPVPAAAHAARSQPAHPQSARDVRTAKVWITTPDGTQRLAEQGAVAFQDGTSDAPTVVVDPNRRFQTMAGFGASITDSSASVLSTLT